MISLISVHPEIGCGVAYSLLPRVSAQKFPDRNLEDPP
jgi:hypothetical protein